MKRLFLLTMAFAIVITGCKKDKQPGEETPAAVPVEEITLSAPEGVIYMGADVQLTATVLPEDASEKSLKWSSSDETIAEVNSTGLVSFFNQGSVTITAKAKDDSDVSATINLAAQPWRLVFVKNYPNDFPKNSTEEISTSFSSYILKEDDVFEPGDKLGIMSYIPLQYRLVPVDLTYSGEYEKIFGVTEQAQKIEGTLVLTALDAGVGAYECEIEAALPNLKKKATIKYLKGEVVGPTSVSIGEDFSMTVDDVYDVSADLVIAAPEGADKSVTFTSSNPEVLEVDGTILTAKKAGTATLRVEAAVGGQSDECQVIVYDKPTGIEIYLNGSLLSKDAPILFEVGDEKTFEAKILPETADQSLWSVTYDPNQDIFENSGIDLTFRALKAGTLEVEISTDIASFAKTITLKVEEPFTLTPSVTESLAGSAVTITSNKKVVSWEKTYSTSNVLGMGAGTITSTSDTEAELLLPLIVNTRTEKPVNSTMTITATDEEGNTATCEVVSKGWYVRYYDSSSQSELTGDVVSAEQQVVAAVVDYQGNIITRTKWYGSITATVSDGVEFVQDTPNSVIYKINSGYSSYVFTFAANDDNTLKNTRIFTLN